jgi:acetolactate synthase-1/2/3 large subunit
VQARQIDPAALKGFAPEQEYPSQELSDSGALCAEILGRIENAKCPVVLAGSGIRHSGSRAEFAELIRRLRIPVVLSRTAHDLLPADHPLRCGRAGIDADRAGNIVVQNADLLLVLGSRLGVRQVGYDYKGFAPRAFKYHVDVDPAELAKPTVKADRPVLCDLKRFLAALNDRLAAAGCSSGVHAEWLRWAKSRVERYPGVTARHRNSGGKLNPYVFLEALFARLADDEVIACGNGASFIMTFHAGPVRKNQRVFFNSGTASMGYDVPAAVGAALANHGRRVVCIAGEGSIQMNIQELQTAVHHNLPVKVFVLANGGYLSIRTTQLGFFGNLVGESPASGVSFPDLVKLCQAYGISAARVESLDSLALIDQMLAAPGPALFEVVVDPNQQFEPRVSSRQMPDGTIVSPPIEDMYPFLEREEMAENVFPANVPKPDAP